MKVTAYLRVSTDKQADEGAGLDVQRDAIKKWARAEGHRVVSWHSDEGVSGSNGLESRRALTAALADLNEGTARGLVVYRLDRLARDLVLQEQLLAELKRMSVDVFTTSAGEAAYLQDDPKDPSRALIRQILGAVNQYERSMIRLRLEAGIARKREQGGYAGGKPPYGYQAVGKELIPEPAEQDTLTRMRALHDEGKSGRQIAEQLTHEGRPARGGGEWRDASVSRILKRSR